MKVSAVARANPESHRLHQLKNPENLPQKTANCYQLLSVLCPEKVMTTTSSGSQAASPSKHCLMAAAFYLDLSQLVLRIFMAEKIVGLIKVSDGGSPDLHDPRPWLLLLLR